MIKEIFLPSLFKPKSKTQLSSLRTTSTRWGRASPQWAGSSSVQYVWNLWGRLPRSFTARWGMFSAWWIFFFTYHLLINFLLMCLHQFLHETDYAWDKDYGLQDGITFKVILLHIGQFCPDFLLIAIKSASGDFRRFWYFDHRTAGREGE